MVTKSHQIERRRSYHGNWAGNKWDAETQGTLQRNQTKTSEINTWNRQILNH